MRDDQGDDRSCDEEVTEAFIHDLTERVRESKGDTLLRLNVYDRGAQVLAAPLLEKPQGEPLAISGRIFGRQQHPLLNRISIL